MKKYINDSHRNCYILNKYGNNEEVQFEASEYWVLYLYIITLKTSNCNSPHYLVLEYPSYTEHINNGIINDCIWSVPYTAYLLKKEGAKRYTSVGDIKSFYNEQLQTHKDLLIQLENYRFYHMGISNYQKKPGETYIEYKKSTRQPDKWKCYYIQEYYIDNIDSLGLLNLADPEGLHSYRYYPLEKQPNKNPNSQIYFLGKHLSTNIAHILRNSWSMLKNYSNTISSSQMCYEMKGILVKLDIVGFTKIYNGIVEKLGTLEESGDDLAKKFISQISYIFETRLKAAGFFQYVIEGDGFTATYPLFHSERNEKNTSKKILALIDNIKKDMDSLLKRLDIKVGIRCSILSGQYTYGKINNLSTLRQNFSGEIMIVLTRMDEYLKNLAQPSEITIGINNNLYSQYSDLFDKDYIKYDDFVKEHRQTNINTVIMKRR